MHRTGMAKLPLDAQHHPYALQEALVIATSAPHLHALTLFGPPYDALFDGVDAQGRKTWLGATQSVDDFCGHVAGTKGPKIYAEPFWGSPAEGIVVSFCVTDSGRPVLMSIVPFNGPRPTDPADEIAAKVQAVADARRLSVDL